MLEAIQDAMILKLSLRRKIGQNEGIIANPLA